MKRAISAALLCMGCMSSTEHTTTTRTLLRHGTGPAVGGRSWVYAVLVPVGGDLMVDVGLTRMCRGYTDSMVTQRRVTRIRASDGRWVGAILLAFGGSLLVAYSSADAQRDTAGPGLLMIAGGVATWGFPLLAERDKVRGAESHVERGATPPAPCVWRRLGDVRVALRSRGATHEAETDSQGRVVFARVAPDPALELFVEDMAVHDVRWFRAGPASPTHK